MIYTSGTTGKPKGALRTGTDRGIVVALLAELGLLHENAVHLTTGPLYHSGPLAFALLAHTLGAPIVVLRKFDPTRVDAPREGAPRHQHVLRADAAEAHRVAARRRARARRPVVDGCLIANAAPVPYALKQEIIEKLGDGFLYEVYGSTELGVDTVLKPEDQLRKPGSCGKPYGGIEMQHRERRRHRAPRPASRASCSSAPTLAMDGYHHTDEQLTELRRRRLEVGRRRRVRRRRGLRLHLRPQEGHDHLGRREHLSRRDRGRAPRAPAGARRRGVRHPRRRMGRARARDRASRSRARRSTSTSCARSSSARLGGYKRPARLRGARRAAAHRLGQAAQARAARRVLAATARPRSEPPDGVRRSPSVHPWRSWPATACPCSTTRAADTPDDAVARRRRARLPRGREAVRRRDRPQDRAGPRAARPRRRRRRARRGRGAARRGATRRRRGRAARRADGRAARASSSPACTPTRSSGRA